MKKAKKLLLIVGAMVFAMLGSSALISNAAIATDLNFDKALTDVGSDTGLQDRDLEPTSVVTQAIKWIMYAVGIVSVVMIVVGGIRYATSGGNAEKVKSAKNTILYACVGLAVALLALAIVNLVKSTVDEVAPSTQPQDQEESE